MRFTMTVTLTAAAYLADVGISMNLNTAMCDDHLPQISCEPISFKTNLAQTQSTLNLLASG
jgi:hypothetical protein